MPLELKNFITKMPADYPKTYHILDQGMPGTGKSIAAATFPNITWAAFETGIFQRKDDVKKLYDIDITTFNYAPFYQQDFSRSILAAANSTCRELKGVLNVKDAFYIWLRECATKLPVDATLVLDSWTALQEYFDIFQDQDKKVTKSGEEDAFYFWGKKIEYSEKICSLLESLQCSVFVICHESQDRDKVTGKLLDKVQPLMQGKFVTKFKRYFSHCFRSKVIEDENKKLSYVWQCQSDKEFDAKSGVGYPLYIPAHYKNLL